MTASILCISAERRGAPYADAQYWRPLSCRYGRCIVKGYPYTCSVHTLQYKYDYTILSGFQCITDAYELTAYLTANDR